MAFAWAKMSAWRSKSSCRNARTASAACFSSRSEEHTSELQSLRHLVCRLLLEKKKHHAANQIRRNETNRPNCREQPRTEQKHQQDCGSDRGRAVERRRTSSVSDARDHHTTASD